MDPLLTPDGLRRLGAVCVLLDARSREAFTHGHLPGALHADPDVDLSAAGEPDHDPARGGRHPLPSPAAWARRLGEWGITPGIPVVVYDEASGGNAAARAWWMLRAAGHADCAVLDGGLQAALAAGFERSQEPSASVARPPYPFDRWRWPSVPLETVAERVRDPAWVVLDVRSAERWRGETEPFDPVAGRIPGARNLFWQENLGEGGRFKGRDELRAMYESLLGGRPPDRLIVHCGSGVTACHTLLALEAAGLPGASLYVGSWSEWCRSGREIGRS